MAASTLQNLVEAVANRYDLMKQAVATGGTTSAPAFTSDLFEDDDYWNDAWLYDVAADQERRVKTFTNTGAVCTTYGAFSTVPTGRTFQFYDRWSHASIVTSVNSAIARMGGYWPREVVDESLTTLTDTWSYSLSGLSVVPQRKWGVREVWVKWVTNLSTYEYHQVLDYYLRWSGETPTLQLSELYPTGRTIRLIYQATLPTLSTPASTLAADAGTWADDFIVEWALFELHMKRVGKAPSADKRTLRDTAQMHRDEAERLRREHALRLPPGQMRIEGRREPIDEGRWIGAWHTPT